MIALFVFSLVVAVAAVALIARSISERSAERARKIAYVRSLLTNEAGMLSVRDPNMPKRRVVFSDSPARSGNVIARLEPGLGSARQKEFTNMEAAFLWVENEFAPSEPGKVERMRRELDVPVSEV